MPQKQNPTARGRASRVSFGDWTHDAHTLSAYRTQHLIGSYGIRPELASMLATLAFGGASHG